MKIKYRIQNIYPPRRTKDRKQHSGSSNMISHKKHIRTIIIGTFLFGILLAGCSPTIEKPDQGLSETLIEAHKIVNDSLNTNNPFLRVNAIEVAATTKQINYMPTIQKLLQDPYVPVRFAAAVAIGEMQFTNATNAINQLLRDNDPNVIIAASYAMSRIGFPDYIEVLRDSALNNNSQVIKANSALLLGKSGDTESKQLLYRLMKAPDSSDMVSYNAAEALATLGDEKIFETLWTMLISTYADVRIVGVNAMGALGTSEAENALLTMLSDQVIEIRLAAAEQLGKMNNNSGKNIVREVFEKKLYVGQDRQSVERILTFGALAIGEIGTKDLTKFLPELMKSESPFVRLAAAKAVIQTSGII